MGMWRRFALMWLALGAYLLVLFALIAAQGILDSYGIISYLDSLFPFAILHLVALAGLAYALKLIYLPRAVQETKAHGISAKAEVLEVKLTGWRMRRWLEYPRKYEHRLRLRVQGVELSPYEATTYAFVLRETAPAVGSIVNVQVHPEQHEILVLTESQEKKSK